MSDLPDGAEEAVQRGLEAADDPEAAAPGLAKDALNEGADALEDVEGPAADVAQQALRRGADAIDDPEAAAADLARDAVEEALVGAGLSGASAPAGPAGAAGGAAAAAAGAPAAVPGGAAAAAAGAPAGVPGGGSAAVPGGDASPLPGGTEAAPGAGPLAAGQSTGNDVGTLAKAYLEVKGEMGPSSSGEAVLNESAAKRLEFLFNPKEYSISKSTQAPRTTNANAEGSSPPQFTGPQPQTLSVELFLDATEGDPRRVVDSVEFLMNSCSATRASRDARQPAPPVVVFGWGQTQSFPAFVKQVQVKYTMFTPQGVPMRAACSVSLEEVPPPDPGQNPTSGGKTARRTHTVVAGETLASVAWDTYRNAGLWRSLAEANDIDDPMRLSNGRRLLVPTIADARRDR